MDARRAKRRPNQNKLLFVISYADEPEKPAEAKRSGWRSSLAACSRRSSA